MSNADSAEDATTAKPRHHKRTFTGYGKQDLKKELAKWPEETLALWDKYNVGESDGLYLI